MIIVIAKGTISPDLRQAYLDAVAQSGAVEATRTEPGCAHYDVSASASSSDGVYITECWAGFRELQGHMQSQTIARLNALNSEFGAAYEAKVYNAAPVG